MKLHDIATEEALSRMSDLEKFNIQVALHSADLHGHGNVMAWIATAWAHKLMDEGLTMDTAIDAVSNRGPFLYPFSALEAKE
jgi:hypothetical protein